MLSRTVAVALLAAAAWPAAAHPRPTGRPGPYAVELLDDGGAPLPTFRHDGRTYVLGALGQRYVVRVRNGSWRRAEVVLSVDGRDAVDGLPASFSKRGYLVGPRSEIVIDGFRLGERSVAAFRFSSVSRSYAARTGDARDVGVIGVAVFPERPRPALALPWSPPSPSGDATDRSAPPVRSESGVAPAPAAPSAAPAPEAAQRHAGGGRPGLGTEFGEERDSPVERVAFERASAAPEVVLALRYDDREGLLALGIDVDGRHLAGDDAWLRRTADPFRTEAGFARPPPGWSGR